MLTRRRSRLGPPLAVVAVARILLVPAGSVVLMLASAQVSQLVVGLNAMSLAMVLLLTLMSIGRLTVVPLAYRNVRMTVPATSWLTGFVDYTNVAGSSVEFTVNQLVAGTVILTFRYANGTTVNRPMDISVNSNTIANDMAFNPTTNWDTWADASINTTLPAGTSKIRATATTADGGPNLDRLRVSIPSDTQRPTAPGQPTCPDTEI